MQMEQFSTGARRDPQGDKVRWDLVPYYPLYRVAQVYTRGAVDYGDDNWRKGMPFRRTIASTLRHFFNYIMRGKPAKPTDDDLAQAVFGCFTLMQHEAEIKLGRLPVDLDDRYENILEALADLNKAIPARKSPNECGAQVPIEISTLLGMGCPNEVAHQVYGGISGGINTGPYIYVAGPMRGYKEFNFPLFDEARDALLHAGWRVISPADIDRAAKENVTTDEQATASIDKYVERDVWALRLIKKLSPNDGAILMLPMWVNSDGASVEFALAKWLRLDRYQYNPMTKEAPVCPKS